MGAQTDCRRTHQERTQMEALQQPCHGTLSRYRENGIGMGPHAIDLPLRPVRTVQLW